MEVLKEKLLKKISDFCKETFEQIDISEWDTVVNDKCIRLIGTLIIKEDYLYKTYGKLIKNKKYEVLIEYQLTGEYLEKITIEGTLGGSLVALRWNYSLNKNNEISSYNLYPHGNNEELNILIPEATKIMETILSFIKTIKVED